MFDPMKVTSEIWILEDDPLFQSSYRQAFASRAGGIRVFSCLKTFLDAVLEKEVAEVPAAAILDLSLKDGNLVEEMRGCWAKPLEAFFSGVPSMVVSGCDSLDALRQCFRSGVRDYLVKPFSLNELLVKVERMVSESNLREVEAGTRGALTPREKTILELLFQALESKQVTDGFVGVSRQEILARVWPNVVVTPGSVDVHLSHLRRKLENSPWEIQWVGPERWTLVRKA